MNFKAGDIVFVDSGTFVGKLVKKATGFKYGHVALAIDENHLMDIKAFSKSKILNVNEVQIKNCEVFRVTEPYDLEKLIQITKDCTGIPYDYIAILRLFLRYVLHFNIKRKGYDVKRLYCSEFIDYAFNEVGVDLVEGEESLISIECLYYSKKLEVR